MPIEIRLKVGERILLRKSSRYWGQSGGKVGVIQTDDGTDEMNLPYLVHWAQEEEDGREAHYWYGFTDLKHASIVYAEDHLKEKDIL